MNDLDCLASSLFETLSGSRITLQIYGKHKLGESVHNKSTTLKSFGYSKGTSLFLIKFENNFLSQFDKYL